MRKLTKANIEKLAKEVIQWAKDNELGYDWLLFFNGIKYDPRKGIEKANPIDYCIYFPENFIMGMAYDGTMYEVINEYYYDTFGLSDILNKYGLYLEHLDYNHCHFYEANDDMDVEYTVFEREKEYNLYGPDLCEERWTYVKADYPHELDGVMCEMRRFSAKGYHDGYCIIGESIEFKYKGKKYNMSACCVYQGVNHFRRVAEYGVELLKELGATEIRINEGMID